MIAQLVKKFFDGSCTQVEKSQIASYMENHPEEIETYFSDNEWEQFETHLQLDKEVTTKMWAQIHQAVHTPKVRYLHTWKVAAAILLIMGFGIGYTYWSEPAIAPQVVMQDHRPSIITKTNNGDSVMTAILPDGSQVSLMPKSNISYDENYGDKKRDIKLVGEAIFKVASNKNKPFTVFSNQLSTTALGTIFKVSSISGSELIKVHLYEGKVVVKQLSNTEHKYFLRPGDRLVFNKASLIAKVTAKKKELGQPKRKGDGNGVSSWYMFDNQTLAEVFEQMEDIYNVKIHYSERDIRHIRFIGKIEQNDPISMVLKDIALMNNLNITLNGDTYFIKKK